MAEAMNAGKEKVVIVQGNIIVLSSISAILKEEKAREHDDEQAKFGMLHDGTRVVRQFGEWFCMQGERDENNLYAVRPDLQHYPEVRANRVPSIEMFEAKFISLSKPERLALMLEGIDEKRFIGNPDLARIEVSPEFCEKHQTFIVDCTCAEQRAEDQREIEASEKLEV